MIHFNVSEIIGLMAIGLLIGIILVICMIACLLSHLTGYMNALNAKIVPIKQLDAETPAIFQ